VSRHVAAAIAALILVGGAVAGGIVVATGSSAAVSVINSAQITTSTVAVATTGSPDTATTVQQSQPATPTTPTTTTTTATTATEITPATLATPIVTYPADIGVLAPRDVIEPVRIVIPSLAIDGPVIPAGVNTASELAVPSDARTLVWYRHGPSPGEPGSAVIGGHLNWRGVNGLFAKLADAPVGAAITVVYGDGSEQTFIVSTVELLPKPAVAVNGVFAREGERLLRLVTCGGEFEEEVHSYRSNVVVTAVPA
jgi:sortase (surface protein transpeptidase)